MFKQLSKLVEFAGYVVQYTCWTHVTFEYGGDFVFCSGPSMEPTLYSNNVLLTEKISHRRGGLLRGDIIVAKNPQNPRQSVCKRVIALPGDRVITQSSFHPFSDSSNSANKRDLEPVENEHVEHLEDADLDTGALTQRTFRSNVIVVPRGHVWVEGDNPANSLDSREFGPIPLGLIRSRAVIRLWPLSEMRML